MSIEINIDAEAVNAAVTYGSTGVACLKEGRRFLGIEANADLVAGQGDNQ